MMRTTRLLGLAALTATAWALFATSAASAAIGMVCTNGTLAGTTRTFNLVANSGNMQTPDGNANFMWSYANADTGSTFQIPGPVLCANTGETVVVHLHNSLPTPPGALSAENTSIVFPAIPGVSSSGGVAGLFTNEAAPGGDVTYTFTASKPGTFLYESGTDPSRQVEMGMYSALVVRPAGHPDWAYNDASTQFNPSREYILITGEIDSQLHHLVETTDGSGYDVNGLKNRYFTVTGRDLPDTLLDNSDPSLPHQPYGALVRVQPYAPASSPTPNPLPALVRIVNGGLVDHPFHPHGFHLRMIAEDGNLFRTPASGDASTERYGDNVAAGASQDALFWFVDKDFLSPTNQVPVTIPSYKNLTFEDNNTWFSGSVYLGYKGTLPTGVTSQNVCGEQYFPWHSHALNEFTNYDELFGGMGTLLRVDPLGGCFGLPTSTAILTGLLKSGSGTNTALGTQNDTTYYQVNPRTTTKGTGTLNSTATTMTVTSSTGFPPLPFYARIDNEVIQVTAMSGTGNNTWTIVRHQLSSTAASHSSGATITALSNDWYAGFSGVPPGALNLSVTYQGKNCSVTTTAGNCGTALAPILPAQTVKICNWAVSGATGCSAPNSPGWVTLPAPPAQPQGVGSSDVTSTWTVGATSGTGFSYLGSGAYAGQVRILVHTERSSSPPTPTTFSTWGNFMKIVYDAP
jgi:hypothetical protein